MSGQLALLATDFPPGPGGIQTLTWEVYRRLADLTAVVIAPAGDASAASYDSELPVKRLPRGAGAGWRALPYLYAAASCVRGLRPAPAVVHCNHLFAGYAGWWLRRRTGLPYLVWVHGEEMTKGRYRRLMRASLSGAAALLVNSDYTAAVVRNFLGSATPPLCKIPLGASNGWLAAPPTPPPAGAEPVLLSVARLCARDRYKGIDTCLRTLARLRERGLRCRYRIVGDGDDRAYLEGISRELGIAAQVEFLGRVTPDALMAQYDACDIFLLCSREQTAERGVGFEGFGIVLLEAAARARPAVAGRSGGIPDAVADGVSGLLVDPQSPGAVADAVARLWSDPGLRQRLGAQARARVAAGFTWDHAAAAVRRIHRQLSGTEARS